MRVYTTSWLWTHLSRVSRQHWENLASHDPARNDVRNVLNPAFRAGEAIRQCSPPVD